VLGGVAAVLAVLVGLSFVVGSDDDAEDAAGSGSASGSASGPEDTAGAGGSESDAEDDDDQDTLEPSPSGGPTVTSGELALTLPEGWVGADLSEGAPSAGEQMFPEDPDIAAVMDDGVAMLPRVVRIAGFEESGVREGRLFVSNVNLLQDTNVPPGMAFEQMMEFQSNSLRTVGADVIEEDIVEIDGRRFGRLQSEIEQGQVSYTALSYVVEEGGDVYVITFSFADPEPSDVALADASAASFTVE
jgi:hypothetical protein